MGTTKTEFFSEKQNTTATLLKALGHPARIAIIEHLLKVNACICGDIVNELPLSQPTVSQHLKELKNAGIIKGSIEGNTICYCLNETTVARLRDYFGNIVTKLENGSNCC
ncbi:MAG: transcriptional regulator [Flavobacterium psychrophilum]|nr:MAG: transcriptional regulator [Flavobacterium psychrophilum]